MFTAVLTFAMLLPFEAATSSNLLPDAPLPQQAVSAPAATRPMPNPAWHKVELLNFGEPIALLELGHSRPILCTVDHVDEHAIACKPYYSPTARLTLPIASIASISVEEQQYGPSATTFLIAAGIGAGIGAILFHEGGARGIALGAMLGSASGIGIVLSNIDPFPRPRIHRRVIYRAP